MGQCMAVAHGNNTWQRRIAAAHGAARPLAAKPPRWSNVLGPACLGWGRACETVLPAQGAWSRPSEVAHGASGPSTGAWSLRKSQWRVSLRAVSTCSIAAARDAWLGSGCPPSLSP
eukprot:360558-Chlamydomonas_euryale.AAC.3